MAQVTIGISEEVWQKLNSMKKAGVSFDDILRKLLKIKEVKNDKHIR